MRVSWFKEMAGQQYRDLLSVLERMRQISISCLGSPEKGIESVQEIQWLVSKIFVHPDLFSSDVAPSVTNSVEQFSSESLNSSSPQIAL